MSTLAVWEQDGVSYEQTIFDGYVEHTVQDPSLPWGYPTWFGVIETQPDFEAAPPPPAPFVFPTCCTLQPPPPPVVIEPVPEAGTALLLSGSLVALAMLRRMRRKV